MSTSEDQKALEAAFKQLGKLGIRVQKLGDQSYKAIEVIPTGSLGLDIALGVGGYPRGRIIEVYGHEMSGKSTLTLIGMGIAQKLGGTVALIDAENSFDPSWARTLGVTAEDVIVTQPDYGEQAFEVIDKLAASNAVDLIVVDSTAALVPKAEFEGSYDDKSMALQARMLSTGLRKLVPVIGKSKACVIMINQIRTEVGKMFGNPNITPGGKALKFYSSVRMEVQKSGKKEDTYKVNDVIVGHKVRVKIQKNKVAAPFRSCEFDLYFDRGIDIASELPKLAVDTGLVQVSGRTYTYGEYKWVGYDNYDTGMKELSPEALISLREQILNVDKASHTSELPESPEDDNTADE